MESGISTVLVSLKNVTVQLGGMPVLDDVNLQIHPQEQWAIIGSSGSGKTTLAHVLMGRVFHRGELNWQLSAEQELIELVEQQHHFKNLSNTSSFYYQQRFNASDSEDSKTVADTLNITEDDQHWIELLHLKTLLPKPLLQLSNGENKRLQLAMALLKRPGVLIL